MAYIARICPRQMVGRNQLQPQNFSRPLQERWSWASRISQTPTALCNPSVHCIWTAVHNQFNPPILFATLLLQHPATGTPGPH